MNMDKWNFRKQLKFLIISIILITVISWMTDASADDALVAAATCAAILEASEEHGDAFWWRSVVENTVGSKAAARSLIDKYALMITDNINNGSITAAVMRQALSECRSARARAN